MYVHTYIHVCRGDEVNGEERKWHQGRAAPRHGLVLHYIYHVAVTFNSIGQNVCGFAISLSKSLNDLLPLSARFTTKLYLIL